MTSVSKNIESTPTVQLFILSRDRVEFCREAVASAVGQTYDNCQVVVSDNSETEYVAEMLAKEFPEVIVIRRKPTLPALTHFNTLIDEAVAPLMVLFHDDDVLEPDYVSLMVSLLQKNPECGLVGCNARIIRSNRLTNQKFMGDFRGTRMLMRQCDLFEPYLSLSLNSPAPFPGYMYRTSIIKGLGLYINNGGKHADVSFLASALSRAYILWTEECLFRYRFHGGNDSNVESIVDRLSWMRHLYKTAGVAPRSIFATDYKYLYWLNWLKQQKPRLSFLELFYNLKSHRRTIASRFVIGWSLRMVFTRLSYWKRFHRFIARYFDQK